MKIKYMKFIICGLVFFNMLIINSCGKGGGDGSSGNNDLPTGTEKVLSFTAAGAPVSNSVYLEKVSVNNDEISLAVKVKGGADIYGAVMEITYDSSKINYVASSEGDYLGKAADILFYKFLVNHKEGALHIAIDKKGGAAGTNGDGTLATIVLKALAGQDNTTIGFNTTISNLMRAVNNNPVSGTSWFGGALSYK